MAEGDRGEGLSEMKFIGDMPVHVVAQRLRHANVKGTRDTYAHAPCEDGGTNCPGTNDRRIAATVPGATPANDYTYVLYPLSQDALAQNGVTFLRKLLA